MFQICRDLGETDSSDKSSNSDSDNEETERSRVSNIYNILGELEPSDVATSQGTIPHQEYYLQSRECERAQNVLETLCHDNTREGLKEFKHLRGIQFFAFMDKEKAIQLGLSRGNIFKYY